MRVFTFFIFSALVMMIACRSDNKKPELFIDETIPPGHDFYSYVNGKWISEPASEIQSVNIDMRNEVLSVIRNGLRRREKPERFGRLYDFFESLSGDIPRDSIHKSLRKELSILDSLEPSVPKLMATAYLRGYRGPLSGHIVHKNRKEAIFNLEPGRAGFSKYFTLYDTYYQTEPSVAGRMIPVLGLDMSQDEISEIDFIQRKMREIEVAYNNDSEPQEIENLDSIPSLRAFLNEIGITKEEKVRVPSAAILNKMEQLVGSHSFSAWKNYYTWVFFEENLLFASEETATFYSDLLSEFTSIDLNDPHSEGRAIKLLYNLYRDPLIDLYRYLESSEVEIQEISKMAENIRNAMISNVQKSPWMEESTRKKVASRLDSTEIQILYPDDLNEYDRLKISRFDPIGNIHRAEVYNTMHQLEILDNERQFYWEGNTLDDSPYCSRYLNAVFVTASFAVPPLFDVEYEDSFNYGGLGFYIGHEMAHLFDYDSDSIFVEPYYYDVKDDLISQYSSYTSNEGFQIDGLKTLNENFCDIIGLNAAYHAFVHRDGSSSRSEAEIRDFFVAFANSQREYRSDSSVFRLIMNDEHTLSYIRVNGTVRNIDPFYAAFTVTPSDSLYLPPADRIRLW